MWNLDLRGLCYVLLNGYFNYTLMNVVCSLMSTCSVVLIRTYNYIYRIEFAEVFKGSDLVCLPLIVCHKVFLCVRLGEQAQLWQLAQRTTALPFGRGAFTLATSRPMLTEVHLCFMN